MSTPRDEFYLSLLTDDYGLLWYPATSFVVCFVVFLLACLWAFRPHATSWSARIKALPLEQADHYGSPSASLRHKEKDFE